MIKKADLDQDGFVTSEEFCGFLAKDLNDIAVALDVEIDQPKPRRNMTNQKGSVYKKTFKSSNKKKSFIGQSQRKGRNY